MLCVATDESGVRRRAEALGRTSEELRENGLAGSPSEVVDKIGRLAETGTSRMYLQFMDLADLDQLELVATEVIPQLS